MIEEGGRRWRPPGLAGRLGLAACAVAAGLLPYAASAAPDSMPDNLEASEAELTPDGIVRATDGVLHVTSLVEGVEFSLSADSLEYDTNTGYAELSGQVLIEAVGMDLSLRCDYLSYDPLMQRMQVEGLQLDLPLNTLQGKGPDPELPQARLGDHYYIPVPETLYLKAEQALLDFDPLHREFVLHRLRFSHHPHPDPDLYVTAREARYGANNKLTLSGLALYISGIKLLTWPKLTRRIPPQPGPLHYEVPHVSLNREQGLSVKQGMSYDFGSLTMRSLIDYSTNNGLRAYSFVFIEPAPGTELGVAAGELTETNVDRLNLDRRDDYNIVLHHRLDMGGEWANAFKLDAEYGRVQVSNEEDPELGLAAQTVSEERLMVNARLELPPATLSDELFLTTAMLGRYANYAESDKEYQALGGEAGLIWRHGGYDHFVLYRAYEVEGQPVILMDKVRAEEIDFATSMHPMPGWRQVLQGVYDMEREEFDLLQLGVLKAMRSYEIGLYWDFARENAGLEFGLLLD